MDVTTGDHHQYIGIVSVADIALHIAEAKTFAEQASLMETKITSLIGATPEGRSLWVTEADKSLLYAIEPLGKRVHRILVPREEEGEGKQYALMTQTDVLRFLSDHASEIAGFLDMPVSTVLAKGDSPSRSEMESTVVSVPRNLTAFQAFNVLRSTGVTAAPVVDEDGSLVETLSFSDLRGLDRKELLMLHNNVMEFLEEVRHKDHFGVTDAVRCTAEATLGECIEKMLTNRVHRLWVCEGDVVTGVLSGTSIIKLLRPTHHEKRKRKQEDGNRDDDGEKRQKTE